MIRYAATLISAIVILCHTTIGQVPVHDSTNQLTSTQFGIDFHNKDLADKAAFSLVLNGRFIHSDDTGFHFIDSLQCFRYLDLVDVKMEKDTLVGNKLNLSIKSISPDTVIIENVVPFHLSERECFITAEGPWSLARTYLYRIGRAAVGVILPDNAWEMGYASIKLDNGKSISAIARRSNTQNARKGRYKTFLYKEGQVNYSFFWESWSGTWQKGIKTIFRDHYLYDMDSFEDSLYRRTDLKWIQDKYLIVLQFAWDHAFYDPLNGGYQYEEFFQRGMDYCGGIDIFGIWPTWPTLGVDQRNQWDLYDDLPGGLPRLAEISAWAKTKGTRFFIAYNPWDQSTRKESPYKAMAALIEAIDADGVILDTKGNSSIEIQGAADSVKSGVVMYSEGMAVPRDMPGIISGRVHDAIFMPPPLNLNKLIKPDFNIFRVCQLSQGRIHREVALSLFNGYGIELNTFAPGRPEWIPQEMTYLGQALKILRENSMAFKGKDWTPLIATGKDYIWVNQFPGKDKMIYTVFSLVPEGYAGPLFESNETTGHYVSLWHHKELALASIAGKKQVPVRVDPFNREHLGSRQEGNVDCIAWFPHNLQIVSSGDSLSFSARKGDEIRIWSGNPSYKNKYVTFKKGDHKIRLIDHLGVVETKVVIQLLGKGELLDERVIMYETGKARKYSTVVRTTPSSEVPNEMVEIPASSFRMIQAKQNSFIPYPEYDSMIVNIKGFYMDKYPVTNNQFYDFIESTGYQPKDTANFLKHWENNKYPRGAKNMPVVYISLEDAQAYATWAEKRLPTEAEWQYAAQGEDGRLFPWGNQPDSTLFNSGHKTLTSVNEFPGGASPFGVMDMIGNVWQLTNDVYDNGSYYFIIIRGGSYYNPSSSWWYVKGGPQPLNKTQMLLRVSPGFERNSTVGFRCVMDKN